MCQLDLYDKDRLMKSWVRDGKKAFTGHSSVQLGNVTCWMKKSTVCYILKRQTGMKK